jgi:hypothetical protein
MIKAYLFSVVLFLAACSKDKTAPPAVASFSGVSTADPTPQPYTFDDDGVLSCTYSPSMNSQPGSYNGPYYLFNFGEAIFLNGIPENYSISFAIPADTLNNNGFALNQSIQYSYTPGSYYQNLLTSCWIMFSQTISFKAFDSARLNVTISRYSNQTVDGNFTLSVYAPGSNYASAQFGVFKSISVRQ